MTRRCLHALSVCSVDEYSKSETDSDTMLDFDSDSDSGSGQDSESSSQAPNTPVERPLLHCAAEYWFRHYRNIDRARISTSDLDALDKMICQHLQPDSPSLALWLKEYNSDMPTKPDMTQLSPVYYAVKLELKGIPEQLIAHIKDVSVLDRPGPQGTPLQLSAHLGHTAVLNTLVDMGVNVNAVKGDHGTDCTICRGGQGR
ncbi:hypothetical protein GE09DRAFT_534092 [Coniochaeta sp. 2T2.1]|nr:hypothetical protein GE09DRAFT_534092 [Coniochaeta sp. 2T2.1]